ncbi:Dimeric alpha-beta barrel [Phytophthora palmivora]|uniref:Dimeric alpha-beta barrel n=1 Tax=Phytophthora palmivora TaxID=4796 RepID=A0A2P4WWT6_9STRA|nr:Dimeric alpha-beta barrel [Phytophthora palmivora]
MSSASTENKFFILRYNYVDDILERRVPVRSEHLEYALNAKKNGHLVMGGAVANPPDAGIIVFNAPDQQVVEDFAKNDPYVREELVTSYSIREWMVVV